MAEADGFSQTNVVKRMHPVAVGLILVVILALGAYFRFIGLNWDENQHLHPDERFLTMVESAMTPVGSLGDYFDTARSTLNPHNVGFGFFVYGTLPIILVRYLAQAVGQTGYDQVFLVGRAASAAVDLLAVLLVFMTAQRLFCRSWLSLLAAAFYACAVLPIQLSHYLAVDTFTNTFALLAFYFSAVILTEKQPLAAVARQDFSQEFLRDPLVDPLLDTAPLPPWGSPAEARSAGVGAPQGTEVSDDLWDELPGKLSDPVVEELPVGLFEKTPENLTDGLTEELADEAPHAASDEGPASHGRWDWLKKDWRGAAAYVGFGAAYGMALASKISIVPLAALLPAAALVAWSRQSAPERNRQWGIILRNLILGGLVAFLVFRVGQPYAFSGPGFFGVVPNAKWIDNLKALSVQTNGDGDSPPELQWALRPATFAWDNLVNWGLGLPLGLLATAGYLWMGWRILRGRWREYGILWGWTGAYFLWQGLSFTRAMRYQIPIYPLLALIAAWMAFECWDGLQTGLERTWARLGQAAWGKIFAAAIGVGCLLASLGWAFAFTRIYARPMTRVEASRWIYANVPGPINLDVQTPQGIQTQALVYPTDSTVQPGRGVILPFTAQSDGTVSLVQLARVDLMRTGSGAAALKVNLVSVSEGGLSLGRGAQSFQDNLQGQPVALLFERGAVLIKGRRYALNIDVAGSATVRLDGEVFLKSFARASEVAVDVQGVELRPGQPYTKQFIAQEGGSLRQLSLPVDVAAGIAPGRQVFEATVSESGIRLVGTANLTVEVLPGMDALVLQFEPPIKITAGLPYLVAVNRVDGSQSVRLNGTLHMQLLDDSRDLALPLPTHLTRPSEPYMTPFTARASGTLGSVRLAWVVQQDPGAVGPDTLSLSLRDARSGTVLGEAKVTLELQTDQDARGVPVRFQFTPALALEKNQTYFLQLAPERGAVAVRGSAPANESSWDDGLPLRMDGQDGYGGMYQSGLNFEMYWPDDVTKLNRITRILDQADIIFISSNRQWGTTTRVPERYPLTIAYYRALMGCPPERTVVWCYSVAQPGMFKGLVGFDLVQVFQSDPNLGDWKFNTQFAEEAFTVYDHPKVLIFKKRADYAPEQPRSILGTVDLSKVMQVTPRKAGVPGNLMLPSDRLAQQRDGGTWSELFDRDSILNSVPALGAVAWYGFVLLLGWMIYPLVRLGLSGLADRGYPFARLVGMLVLAYLVWLAGSSGAPFTRTTIWLVLGGLLLVNLVIFWLQRSEIVREIQAQPRYYLVVEGLFLAFFVLDLLIRLGNPDLWHPAKGGEKPMDFSYLNAVLKSTSFPPYDPWFAGGYINYYYYGFVLVGVLIKALGIVPAVAYNLVLPTLFAMVALGAFSVGWNLLYRKPEAGEENPPARWLGLDVKPLLAGLGAAVAMLILGNLGTINMIWEGFQLLMVPRGAMESGDLIARMSWTVQGLVKYFTSGMQLPYNIGEWYWNPSRAIPGEPITEFPFFTFLYADLHAHMIALPVTTLALGWALSMVRGQWRWAVENKGAAWSWLQFGVTFALGGLTIGALRPANTWDMPAYLAIGCVAVFYTVMRYARVPQMVINGWNSVRHFLAEMDADETETEQEPAEPAAWVQALIKLALPALPAVLLLAGLALALYQPFAAWYGQGYNSIDLWKGDHTPLWAYRLHWGLFLFVMASWMTGETIDWMAKTPVSALNRLRRWSVVLVGGLVGLGAAVVFLTVSGVQIAWIPLVFGAWAVILILRPNQPDARRVVLFLFGSALVLTLAVELVVLKGDLGRMNTVFKFYLQAWTLFAISSAAALVWLLVPILRWRSSWSTAWQTALVILIGCTALFPLLGGQAKIQDRMAESAPHTLDGMAYMPYSGYADLDHEFKLDEDYRAIVWMQENIKGSPVIVEANTPEYRWGTRFTIYTGLPGVVGWNWHQRQQRGLVPSEWITDRVEQIGDFYDTRSAEQALSFLRQYNVRYIVVGRLERIFYPTGLSKFDEWNGQYWKEVYRDGDTAIYEVLQ